MKTFRSKTGPFREQPYYELRQIEGIAEDELRASGLYPSEPSPVRIDRFIEKRFKIQPNYSDLPDGLLGFTLFGAAGVEEIVVAKALDQEGTKPAERRLRTTLAHEGGHGLLHAHLFALGSSPASLFGDGMAADAPKLLCRDGGVSGVGKKSGYDGRWWEFQANQMMGALLLPQALVDKALDSLLITQGMLGTRILPPQNRESGVQLLSAVFDVNPIVARIRLDALRPPQNYQQLTL
jgi:hypothetical protein